MSPTHRIAKLAVALTCAALLAGCVGEAPEPEPSPEPTASPVFASEEEALAAAAEAYEEYQAVIDDAFMTWDTTFLSSVATGTALDSGRGAVEEYRRAQERQTGLTTVDSLSLEDPSGALRPDDQNVVLYACLDVSGVDVLNAGGESVIPASRSIRFPLHVTLHWLPESDRFTVAEEVQWDGQNFCD